MVSNDHVGDGPAKHRMYALVHPDGTVEWVYAVDDRFDIEDAWEAGDWSRAMQIQQSGGYGQVSSRLDPNGQVDTKLLGYTDAGELSVMAGDVSLLYPDTYADNPVARRMIHTVTGGRVDQPWRGIVAFVEFESEWSGEGIGGFPRPMDPSTVGLVVDLHRQAVDTVGNVASDG